MDQSRPTPDAQAIDWVIRQRDPAFDDWDAFTLWLEADTRHAEAYDVAAVADADAADLPAQPVARAVARPSRRIWLAGGAAAAAALVGIVGYGAVDRSPDLVRVATAAGERRTLTLADGSSIALNGDTRIAIDRDRPRFAALEQGEAMFRVVHDPADPFTVTVGGATVVDVGTVFDIVREAGSTRVAVSEGAVVYNPDAQNAHVAAGRQLQADDADATPRITAIVPALVGGWRTGQLVYDGAPLSTVVADIRRGTGTRITLASGLADRPFRGALLTGGDKGRIAGELAALTGLRATRRQDEWHLTRGGP